jgi:cysteine-rich repeat protein
MRALATVGIALVAITSCAVPSIVDCGDGRVCPAGSVCTTSGCSLPGVCGDGAIDDGELCDDGNRTAGDGCSATCTVEACRNDVVDFGEQCDDGNALSHDGCSSGCLIERPAWTELIAASPPGARDQMAAAWFPDRGGALLHGGSTGSTRSDAWWWNGATWTPTPSGPPPLQDHMMAWDGANTLLMFGGGDAGPTTECWLWSGAWSACVGPVPTARQSQAMATGSGPGEVVLYGGLGTGNLQITWRWAAGVWSDSQRVGPPNATYVTMAYDPHAHEQMLFPSVGLLGKTWTLGPAGWTVHDDVAAARDETTIVYDGDRGTMVGFGGVDTFVGLHNDTFERGALGWTELAVGVRPSPRRNHVAFHDSIRHGIVMFGGDGNTARVGDTWILRWESATLDENCVTTSDADGDGLAGCTDPDCWGRCDPRCPPGVTDCDPQRPRCGDAICNPALESTALCPADCP